MQNNVKDTKQRITNILKLKGPSLPIRIAHEIQSTSLFIGALLSELAKEKIIKISYMKVGSSPLYFLKGQETALENFHSYLPGKEKEAFLFLKENKILEDKQQLPAIRVALRNLKDFAVPFLKDKEVMWRFHSVSEQEVRQMLEPKKSLKKEIKLEIKKTGEKPGEAEKQLDIGIKQTEVKKQIIKEEKAKKPKEKSNFVLKIINVLQNNNMEILEEKDVKKKEFSAVIQINSQLGKIKFLCVAKDKRRITENDLRLILQKSQTLKMPALVLFPGEANKKALEYAETCPLLSLKKIQ